MGSPDPPERNFNQLFAYTRRVAYFRHGRWATVVHVVCTRPSRCIFHGDVGKGRKTTEPCGLWIIHRWRMDAVQSAWLVSAVSARRDSADEQIFYKCASNWHGPDSHFRRSVRISRRRLIVVTRAMDFAARRIFLPFCFCESEIHYRNVSEITVYISIYGKKRFCWNENLIIRYRDLKINLLDY